MTTKRLIEIVKTIKEVGISKKVSWYRLDIRTVESNRDSFVELKLFYKGRLILRIKEGMLKDKTYHCSKKHHEILKSIGMATFLSEDEISWK